MTLPSSGHPFQFLLCHVSLLFFRVCLLRIFTSVLTHFHTTQPPSPPHPPRKSSVLPFTLSSVMETLSVQLRGINLELPTCGDVQCNSHGDCVPPPGGGADLVCECHLGYQGSSCEDTVNGALSLPLSISVVVIIIGLIVLAFIVAKIRQRQKKVQRY